MCQESHERVFCKIIGVKCKMMSFIGKQYFITNLLGIGAYYAMLTWHTEYTEYQMLSIFKFVCVQSANRR